MPCPADSPMRFHPEDRAISVWGSVVEISSTNTLLLVVVNKIFYYVRFRRETHQKYIEKCSCLDFRKNKDICFIDFEGVSMPRSTGHIR